MRWSVMRAVAALGLAATLGGHAAGAAAQSGGAGIASGYPAGPASTLRYRGLRRTMPLPAPPAAAPTFDARIRPAPVAGAPKRPAPVSTLPDPGVRLSSRADSRVGKRIDSTLAQRMGGGTPGIVNDGFVDPRDRLESKLRSYEKPR